MGFTKERVREDGGIVLEVNRGKTRCMTCAVHSVFQYEEMYIENRWKRGNRL
jgi:hypothetical protein